MATNEKRYLPAEVGTNAKGVPHAFHVEGFISKPPYFKKGEGDKKSFMAVNMGIGMNPEKLMALADGTYDKTKTYGGDNGFVTLNIFGQTAEAFSNACSVGLRVAVAGNLEWNTFSRKDGSPGKDLVVKVTDLVVMGSKSVEPIQNTSIGVATRVYTGKDSVERSQQFCELLTGKVVGCDGLQHTDAGKAYLSFGLKANLSAEKACDLVAGQYSKDKSYDDTKRVIRVTVFDRAAEALANVIRKDAELVCSGPLQAREYNGSVSYQMRARVVSVMKFAPKGETNDAEPTAAPAAIAPAAPAGEYGSSGFIDVDDDDDDELPFF